MQHIWELLYIIYKIFIKGNDDRNPLTKLGKEW